MRIFIAILFSPAVKKEISNIIDTIKNKNYHGQVTAHDNLHITLHYLGETNKEKMNEIIEKLQNIATKPFCIKTSTLNTFRKGKNKKILYLGLEYNKKLLSLHHNVIKRLNTVGYDIEDKIYTPHITLMKRVKIEEDDIKNLCFDSIEIEVNSISVMESKRVEEKLVYEEIKNIPLKK